MERNPEIAQKFIDTTRLKRFLAPRRLCMARLATEPVFQKTSCGTLFRTPKGPMSKKKPKEDGVRKLSEHQIRCQVVRFA